MTSTNEKSNSLTSMHKKSGGAKKFWMFTFLVVVAAAAVVLFVANKKTTKAATGSDTFTVRRDNLTVTVAEGGSIRAAKSVQYKCLVRSRSSGSGGASTTILTLEPAGKMITQEDVDNGLILVRLDSTALEDRLATEKMTLATNNDTVISAKESYDIQVINNESSMADSELAVRFALLDLQKYLGLDLANRLVKDINGTSTNLSKYLIPFIDLVKKDPNILAGSSAGQQMKKLHDDIILAQGNLTTQQLTLTGTLKLYDANFVSDLELKQDRLTLQNRQFSLESAQISQALFFDYDFPKNTEQYLSNYIDTLRSYQKTQAQCRSGLAQASSRLTTARTRYDDQATVVKNLGDDVSNCIIKAKAPGLILYGSGTSSDITRAVMGRGGQGGSSRIIDIGESVSEGQVLISIPDTSSWIAEIAVHETEVDKIQPGQPCVITMDVAPDKSLTGTVQSVASLPDQQSSLMNPDLKVYKTIISINGSEEFLKSSMSCRVEILSSRAEKALVVPITAVANRAGKKVCFVVNSQGSSEERVIQAGVFNDKYVQILDGLSEGEQVLLNPPTIIESSGAVDVFDGVQALPKATTGQNRGGQRGGTRGQGMNRGDSAGFEQGQDQLGGGRGRGASVNGGGGGRGGRGGGMGGGATGGGNGAGAGQTQ
jgi:HlyD family secretion protein